MKFIKKYETLSDAIGSIVSTPFISVIAENKQSVVASKKKFGTEIKLSEPLENGMVMIEKVEPVNKKERKLGSSDKTL